MTIPELYELFIHNPKVTTDSRNCPRGSIFFALKGDKFDGNQYAEKALASGCVYAVIDNPDYFIGERTILVDNVLTTLQQLAHRHRKVIGCPIIGITGTNGKTTTTALTGEIMKNYFKDVRVVGNIGIPYTSEAATMTDETVTVAEISSFQLETIHEFHPEISAILNITPDHLNRHHTMECYIRTKEAITTNQTNDEVCVLNYEDEVLRAFGESAPVHVVWFSSARKLAEGFYLDGEEIFYAHDGNTEKVINVNDLNLLGRHNYENVMAATAMSVNFGVPMEKIVEVLKRFQAVEHRIEYVTEKRGVRFYNDSKGTNPDAAIQGIRAMNRPTLLIGGGYDKQSTYDEWIDAFDGKVKKLVLIGQTAEKIEVCAHKHGFMDTVRCETFEEAIRYCYDHAVSGDAVLLSPACASWGMFPNYEERGRIFKEIVRGLEE
mgnify:CR=1 FL=1